MNIYYQDELTTLFHGNAIEILPELGMNFDLTLTDYPYGVGFKYDEYNDSKENLKYLVDHTLYRLIEISERALIAPGRKNLWMFPEPKSVIAWVNKGGTGVNSWGFTCWHPILAYGKDPYLQNKMGSRPDVIEDNSKRKNGKDHPCSKPEGLWEKVLLRGSVKETDIVFDPFVGSGTTLVVAKKNNRLSVGIELSEKYCEIAAKRLQEIK